MILKVSDFALLTIGNLIALLAICSGAAIPGYLALFTSFVLVFVVSMFSGRSYDMVPHGAKRFQAIGLVFWIVTVLASAICAVL